MTVLAQSRFHHMSKSARVRGAFQFVDLPAGPVAIKAYAEGFAPYFGVVNVRAGARVDTNIGLLLEAAASGRVLTAGDEPVAGATVHVAYSNSLPGADILADLASGHVVTDAEGQFGIEGLVPDNTITLQAELDGRISDPIAVRISPGMEQQNLVLRMR